ncbi:MAG: molybdopterin synthase sulfur carrier subunit [Flavobacterium sp.]|nr:MAG: molybdopterin synthase sulfur carrier subunit [Flavobacterium sp.]
MKLTIKYFGLLAEVTQCNEEQFDFLGSNVSELREALYQKYEMLTQTDFQVAQNQILVSNDVEITETEIALLPPFAGG